jgi:hypothetical protein
MNGEKRGRRSVPPWSVSRRRAGGGIERYMAHWARIGTVVRLPVQCGVGLADSEAASGVLAW